MPFDPARPYNDLPDLPPARDVETRAVLKETTRAGRLLSELKGYCQTLPHPELLLNTVVLQESRDSSAIEAIVTTQDELYQAVAAPEAASASPAVKEVLRYREAIYTGMNALERTGGLVTTNVMVEVMQRLRKTTAGVRKNPGTKLMNKQTGAVIYWPPEGEDRIRERLHALERFINEDDHGLDPLVVMALMHYQFEAIHPFSDGNGRTGRILNILYLMSQDLLVLPMLYLSGYVVRQKADYYRLLRRVTEEGDWEAWVLYLLGAVAETSETTLKLIRQMLALKEEAHVAAYDALSRAPAREIVDLMFSYPYLKISTLEEHGIAKRQSASKYLHALTAADGGPGLLVPVKRGRDLYFVNDRLMRLLTERPGDVASAE